VPRKATWLRFETDPAFSFDFFLAEKLGKTIEEIQAMPALRYMQWGIYFGRKAQAQEMAAKRAGR